MLSRHSSYSLLVVFTKFVEAASRGGPPFQLPRTRRRADEAEAQRQDPWC
jgi:hypothetical protein